MKFIENWQSKNLKCHFCGETRSVKYEVTILVENEGTKTVCACNKCALVHESDDSLHKTYTELYKSMGIEPGLFSRTSIGKAIEKKYKDDSIDSFTYSLKYLQENEDNKMKSEPTPTIEDASPFHNLTETELQPWSDLKDKSIEEEENDSLSISIRRYQLLYNLSNEEVISAISEYLNNYNKNYQVAERNVTQNE